MFEELILKFDINDELNYIFLNLLLEKANQNRKNLENNKEDKEDKTQKENSKINQNEKKILIKNQQIKEKIIEQEKIEDNEKEKNKKKLKKVKKKLLKKISQNKINKNDFQIEEEIYSFFSEKFNLLKYSLTTKQRYELYNKIKNIPYLKLQINEFELEQEKEPKIFLNDFLNGLCKINIQLEEKQISKSLSHFFQKYKNGFFQFSLKIPSNFGNIDYKFSVLIRDFYTFFYNLYFKINHKGEVTNKLRKRSEYVPLFLNRLKVLRKFYDVFHNSLNLSDSNNYYIITKGIYFYLNIAFEDCENIDNEFLRKLDLIAYSMAYPIRNDNIIELLNHNKFSILRKGKELSIDEIKFLDLNQKIVLKNKLGEKEINLSYFNQKIFNTDLSQNIEINWELSYFPFIEQFNLLKRNKDLFISFKSHIYNIISSNYVKDVFTNKIKNNFSEYPYIFDNNSPYSKLINEEIDNNIHFIPFNLEKIYGYVIRTTFDIYIDSSFLYKHKFGLLLNFMKK